MFSLCIRLPYKQKFPRAHTLALQYDLVPQPSARLLLHTFYWRPFKIDIFTVRYSDQTGLHSALKKITVDYTLIWYKLGMFIINQPSYSSADSSLLMKMRPNFNHIIVQSIKQFPKKAGHSPLWFWYSYKWRDSAGFFCSKSKCHDVIRYSV